MNTLSLIIITLTAFLLSALSGFIMIPQIMNYAKRKKLYDIPNERKVHKNAIPRLGGISFMPSMILATIIAIILFSHLAENPKLLVSPWSIIFCMSLMIIYTTGVIDDIIGLTATTKFIAQIIAATLLPLSGLYINNLYGLFGINEIPAYVGIPITIFIIVFIDNAINLIDGIDGLAGSLTLLALLGFLYCFSREGLWIYSVLIAGLAGVLIPYLWFNIFGNPDKNRKIFMGDSGSLTLGYILAFLFVKFAMHNPNVMPFRKDSLLLSITILLVPVFDVLRVIVIRLKQHKPLFQADKNHLHHKLMASGYTQHQALIIILMLAVAYAVVNIILYKYCHLNISIIILADVIIHLIFHYCIGRKQTISVAD